jgi:hypothetical protein
MVIFNDKRHLIFHTRGEDVQVGSVIPVSIVTLYVDIAAKDHHITLSGVWLVDRPRNVPRARF